MRVLAGILLIMLAPGASAAAEIFQCRTDDGVQFSDHPCGDTATTVTVPDNHIGGRFDTNLPPPGTAPDEPQPDTTSDAGKPTAQSTCRYINSTTLRTHLVRNEVIAGMTREQVVRAFGRPPETYPVPQETWVYQTDYHGKLYELTYVYFRDGCVESVVYRKP